MMSKVVAIIKQEVIPPGDPDAVEIGRLYGLAGTSLIGSVQYSIECGQKLIAKKGTLKHGEWLPWLEQNADALRFSTPLTAQRFMKLAKASLAMHLDETTAIGVSRKLWGHDTTRGTTGTGDNEWYTPAEVVDAARQVLGVIDLDPASSEQAQRNVQAMQYFSLADDGLKRMWHGNVWLNPPYAQPFIEEFADKMIAEIAACRVKTAIMLTHNYTDTAWFQKLAVAASAICFTRGRIRFESPTGDLASPTQGQAFFFFGANPGQFFEVFRPFGFIARVAK